MKHRFVYIDHALHQLIRSYLDCRSDTAFRVANLYAFLRQHQGYGLFKQGTYAQSYGLARNTVSSDLRALVALGWIGVVPVENGTDIQIKDVDLTHRPNGQLSFDRRSADEGGPVTGCASTLSSGEHRPSHGVSDKYSITSSITSSITTNNKPIDSHSVANCPAGTQEEFKEQPQPAKKAKGKRDVDLLLILAWNEHKPSSWPKLQKLTVGRMDMIDVNGGSVEFTRQLPAFFAGLRKNEFWCNSGRGFTFDEVIGRNAKKPKSWFMDFAEKGADLISPQGATLADVSKLKHPDFFGPLYDGDQDLRPKHNRFKDSDDRKARLAEAIAFYADEYAALSQPQQTK